MSSWCWRTRRYLSACHACKGDLSVLLSYTSRHFRLWRIWRTNIHDIRIVIYKVISRTQVRYTVLRILHLYIVASYSQTSEGAVVRKLSYRGSVAHQPIEVRSAPTSCWVVSNGNLSVIVRCPITIGHGMGHRCVGHNWVRTGYHRIRGGFTLGVHYLYLYIKLSRGSYRQLCCG